MKNLKLFALLCAMAIFAVSCGDEKDEANNPVETSCTKPIDGTTATKFISENGEEVEIQTNYWIINEDEAQFQMNMGGINGNLQAAIVRDVLCKEIVDSENIYVITLYLDKYLDSYDSINLSNIKGISTFEVIGKSLIHKLYVKRETQFEFVENTKVVVPDVTTNHEGHYFKNYVFNQNYDNKSFLSFGCKNWENIQDKFNRNIPMTFETKGKVNDKNHATLLNIDLGDDNATSCGMGCDYGDPTTEYCAGGDHSTNVVLCNTIGDGDENPSTCPQVATYQVLDGINQQSLLDSELSYQFRDEFMVQYQFTQNYITYYYSIGEIVYDNLTGS